MSVNSSPSLSLLLSSHGSSKSKDCDESLTTKEQWLWHFYLTAWPRRFFASGAEAMALEAALKAANFPSASAIAARAEEWQSQRHTMEDKEAMQNVAQGYVYPSLPRVTESAFGRTLRTVAVRDFFSSFSSAAGGDDVTALARQDSLGMDELLREALSRTDGTCEHLKKCEGEALAVEALRAMLSPDNNSYRYALLFDAQIGHPSGDGKNNINDKNTNKNQHDDHFSPKPRLGDESSLRIVLQHARLFAALAVEVFGRVKHACARVLLAYVNHSPDRLADIRICGVVMGIIEYAMAYDRWRADSDGTGRSSLFAAAMLLHAIVDIQSASESGAPAVRIAAVIVNCVEELLFAAVAGGSFKHAKEPADTQTGENVFIRPMAARGLTLYEVDALLQFFLPTLLQQIGFEWPWSESLRRARQLDREEGEKQKKMNQTGEKEDEETEASVRITSHAVFSECVKALSRRTYAARIRGIFPQSFDPIIDAVFPNKTHQVTNGNGNGDNEEERTSVQRPQQPLFTLPEYYRAAAAPLIEFFSRSGLSGTTVEETERILRRDADVVPMIVQLQALGTRGHVNDGDGFEMNRDTAGLANSVEYNNRLHGQANAYSTRLSSVRLSNGEKERLVLRYRCEVLLAALLVHTQLQTVSHVQQLIRQLAPLFEKLLLPLLHERTLDSPLVMRAPQTEQNNSAFSHSANDEPAVSLRFSPEAQVLMNDIHYAFYPLEWIPDAVDALLLAGSTTVHEATPHFSQYSVFAAVAHQFGISLVGSPQGLRGQDATDPVTHKKAHNLFYVLLLNSLVDAPISSCAAEGAAALAITRRVRSNSAAADVLHSETHIASSAVPTTTSTTKTKTTTAAAFHAVVSPHDIFLALAQCLLPQELTTGGAEESLRRAAEWTLSARGHWARHQMGKSLETRANSFTFDTVPLARCVSRAVRRRLLEKMRVGSAADNEHSDRTEMSVCPGEPDPLLQQHLDSLPSLLESIGLLPPSGIAEGERKEPRAVELLWGSPFFAQEVRLSEFYNSTQR